MRNCQDKSSNSSTSVQAGSTSATRHAEDVTTLLDQQFSQILVSLQRRHGDDENAVSNLRRTSSFLLSPQSHSPLSNSAVGISSNPTADFSTLESMPTMGSANNNMISSNSSTLPRRASSGGDRIPSARQSNSTASTPPRSSLGNGNNAYIIDLSRPGETADTRSQNRLEVIRSDVNNRHLPSCVRTSRGWKHRKSSSPSLTPTSKLKRTTTDNEKHNEQDKCQDKRCRPLYILPTSPIVLVDENQAECRHRGMARRSHFDDINRLPLPRPSSLMSPRNSGTSTCSTDDDMVAGVAANCPDCGGCMCSRCLEQRPVTCCDDNASDDCCIDVLSCMCCVKGIASYFSSNKSDKHPRKSPRRTPSGKKDRRVSRLPAPYGPTEYNSSDDEDVDGGCCGLTSDNPCSCQGTARQRTFRFTCLTIMSVFIPCLACYLPCRAAGRGVRWCYNRARAPDACRCPRSNARKSHQTGQLNRHNTRKSSQVTVSSQLTTVSSKPSEKGSVCPEEEATTCSLDYHHHRHHHHHHHKKSGKTEKPDKHATRW